MHVKPPLLLDGGLGPTPWTDITLTGAIGSTARRQRECDMVQPVPQRGVGGMLRFSHLKSMTVPLKGLLPSTSDV